jgi:hypothetical protein
MAQIQDASSLFVSIYSFLITGTLRLHAKDKFKIDLVLRGQSGTHNHSMSLLEPA